MQEEEELRRKMMRKPSRKISRLTVNHLHHIICIHVRILQGGRLLGDPRQNGSDDVSNGSATNPRDSSFD